MYFAIAFLMSLNFIAANRGHVKLHITLSTTLRSLLLHTIALLTMIFLGALVFSLIEGWSYLDSVYWADVTLLTIGFGDISPNTTLGRALLMPYAIAGIVCLGLTVSSIRTLVLDKGNTALHMRRLRKMRDNYLRQSGGNGKHVILISFRCKLLVVFL
jgi:potassium channel subfamily K